MSIRRVIPVLLLLFLCASTALGDGCPYFCKKVSLDLANCYEYLTGNKGTMYNCQVVVWCWPGPLNPIYCEASCEGEQCYWV